MPTSQNPISMGVLWEQYGPYHSARFTALKRHAEGVTVHPLEFSNQTSTYAWNRSDVPEGLITLCPGMAAEELPFLRVFRQARQTFSKLKLDVCFLPSYAPSRSLAALLAAKSLGIRTVMMNESHAGTSRAKGLAATIKRRLVALFDTALVGGKPQKRYIASLGLPEKKILLGYDAVDNDYFAAKSAEVRNRQREIRSQYGLPEHYFLSLGRFVTKKNLATLIRSYRQFIDLRPATRTHLVMVGSGPDDASLRFLCRDLHLPVYEKKTAGTGAPPNEPALERGIYAASAPPCQETLKGHNTRTNSGTPQSQPETEQPGVHFYGFRQQAENPVFYALADAFILPSLYEEWGLVVNEAMACGLPVVVSETAGCAEDLLVSDRVTGPSDLSADLRMRLAQLTSQIRQNGFVFNPKSVHALANALVVLEAAPEIRENMGRASRRIIERFSCDNFAANALLAARAAFETHAALNVI